MHNLLQRVNAISALSSTVLLVLLVAISATTFVLPTNLQSPSLKINNVNVVLGRSHQDYDRRQREYAFARFDIQADLRNLFNWNTKQVFLYFVAEYGTGKYPTNQVVIWDRIIQRKEDARVNIAGAKNKYSFKEITESFKNVSAEFSLQYNVMPYVGALTYGEVGRTERLTFPEVGSRQ